MKFTDPQKVLEVIKVMHDADLSRSKNRALINDLFNGVPPYTDNEEEENNINTNVNFLEATNIAHNARRQFNNAFLKPGNYFTVKLDTGPIHKRSEWSSIITDEINRRMKRSLCYTETIRGTFSQVVLHGIGPVMWEDQFKWAPRVSSIGNVLVPSNTLIGMENLDHFAVYRQFTPAELYEKTHGPKVDKAWNISLVESKIEEARKKVYGQNRSDQTQIPEEVSERFKANLGYFESDAVSTVDCWDFYFRDEEGGEDQWKRCIVLDGLAGGGETKEFLYNPAKAKAKSLDQIAHWQFGDGNNVAPFRYHSVRSLGFLLYSVCHLQNRLRCRLSDSVFENLLTLFRNVSADDRERIERIDLYNYGIVPDGVGFVTAAERNTVNTNLVESLMAMNRQLMSENSSSFVQDVNDGTGKEMTATETMARVNRSTALVSSMLNLAYVYQSYQYREISRRFCIPNSPDKDSREFRDRCLMRGVPKEMIYCEVWDIEPERVLGTGNKTLEIAQADKLMAARNLFDPDAQRKILHIYAEANVDDPALAEDLVPIDQPAPPDIIYDAQLAAGTLLMGLPVMIRQGIDHIDYVEAMLQTMQVEIKKIEESGGTATQDQIFGLYNIAGHIGQHVQIIAQDPNEKQRVKQYGDELGKMMNMVKAYQQRLQEAQQQQQTQQGGASPEAQAKIQAMMMTAQTQAQIKEASANQKMTHKETAFEADQKRKDIAAMADAQGRLIEAGVTAQVKHVESKAKIVRESNEAAAKPSE